MTRVFLDANVLFSAAWSAQSGLLRIWSLSLTRVTSPYAIAEAERNLAHKRPDALERLSTSSVITSKPATNDHFKTGHHGVTETVFV